VALSPDTDIESWAPAHARGVNTEVLEWIASQMRGKRRSNRTLTAMVATLAGVATLPLVHIPYVFDIGM
jgi:phosphoserine phosphatase